MIFVRLHPKIEGLNITSYLSSTVEVTCVEFGQVVGVVRFDFSNLEGCISDDLGLGAF